MIVKITLRMPNGTMSYKFYYGAQALINARNVLQVYRDKVLVAEYPSDSYISWEYVVTPQQPTSRAGLLLQ